MVRKISRMEAEIEGMRQLIEVERKRSEELRQERDRWASALEASQRQITDLTKRAEERPKGGLLGWVLRRA
jgi:chromosome segregation ATPase